MVAKTSSFLPRPYGSTSHRERDSVAVDTRMLSKGVNLVQFLDFWPKLGTETEVPQFLVLEN